MRKNWNRCDETFACVPRLFEQALETMTCNLRKLHMDTIFRTHLGLLYTSD